MANEYSVPEFWTRHTPTNEEPTVWPRSAANPIFVKAKEGSLLIKTGGGSLLGLSLLIHPGNIVQKKKTGKALETKGAMIVHGGIIKCRDERIAIQKMFDKGELGRLPIKIWAFP